MYDLSLEESYCPAHGDRIEPVTVGDILRRSAAGYGEKPALCELDSSGNPGRQWSYSALLHDSVRLARALSVRHEKGTRIAVWAPNIPEWILLEFAAALAGLTLVTVNPSYQKRELAYVLEQSRSKAVYYVDTFRGNPMGRILEEVCAGLPAVECRILLTDHASLFKGEDKGVLPDVDPADDAQIQYTSGTTGFPKGAVLHHTGLVRNAGAVFSRGGMTGEDRLLNHMPLFHTTGCALMVLGAVSVGATSFLPPLFDPVMIAGVIERQKITRMFCVPTMLISLMDAVRETGHDPSSLRSILCSGAMVAPDLVKRAGSVFGAPVHALYGQTECSPVISMVWPDDRPEDLSGTAGQPLDNVAVSVRDPQTGQVLPVGGQGEICVRGYLLMSGYNDNPEATKAAVDDDGWLHTGDLGSMNARGYLSITGRVKDMIIRGGENLFPAEIENAMLEHDDLAEVSVTGVPDEKWGEQVVCFMRPHSANPPDAASLKEFIRKRISPQKTPAYWVYVDEWPLTGSGKIRKFRLREMFLEGKFTCVR